MRYTGEYITKKAFLCQPNNTSEEKRSCNINKKGMAGNTKFWNKFRTNFEKYLWTNLKKNYFDRKKE